MILDSMILLTLIAPAVGVFWGWLVYFLRRTAILPDDGSIEPVPCPWEPEGRQFWLEWLLLHELKGSIFVLIAVSLNTGWPPVLLAVCALTVEMNRYRLKVRRMVAASTNRLLLPPPGGFR